MGTRFGSIVRKVAYANVNNRVFGGTEDGVCTKTVTVSGLAKPITVDISWAEAKTLLDHIDSIDDIEKMAADFDGWLEDVMQSAGPIAKRILFSNVKTHLFSTGTMKKAVEFGGHKIIVQLTWDEAQTLLAHIDSVDDVKRMITNFGEWLDGVMER